MPEGHMAGGATPVWEGCKRESDLLRGNTIPHNNQKPSITFGYCVSDIILSTLPV